MTRLHYTCGIEFTIPLFLQVGVRHGSALSRFNTDVFIASTLSLTLHDLSYDQLVAMPIKEIFLTDALLLEPEPEEESGGVRPHDVLPEVDGAQSLIHDLHPTAREVFDWFSTSSIFAADGMLLLIAFGRAAALVGWWSRWCRMLE